MDAHVKAKAREQTNTFLAPWNCTPFKKLDSTANREQKKRYIPPPHDETSQKERFSINRQIKKGLTAKPPDCNRPQRLYYLSPVHVTSKLIHTIVLLRIYFDILHDNSSVTIGLN